MNFIDIILLLILCYGAFKGFKLGFIVEVATLAALVIGVFIAIKFSGITERLLVDHLNMHSKYLAYIAFGVTFIVVAVGIYLLGKLLTRLADLISLGLFNKLIGAILGAAKAFIVICVVILLLDMFDDTFHLIGEETKNGSYLYSRFLTIAHRIYDHIK